MTSNLKLVLFITGGTQWVLMDLQQLNKLMAVVECPSCQGTGLSLTCDDKKRQGFAVWMSLVCAACGMEHAHEFSSPRVSAGAAGQKPFSINDLLVAFFNQAGLGHTAMKLLGALLGIKVLHLKTFQSKEERLINLMTDATDEVLARSASAVRRAHGVEEGQLLDVTVSFDGSWQKRGHTSLYGFGAVVEVDTGLVLDYTVASKYCHACALKLSKWDEDSPEFQNWYPTHDCCKDFDGSSNAMEVECAKRLWSRSVAVHNIRYTGMLGDGDSKAFLALQDLAPYPGVEIVREECVNHAHKRMGTALMQLAKQAKLGGKGHGRLTQAKIQKLQQYYRAAITSHVGDADGMRGAVWATLLHCMSTDEDPHHTRCPEGPTSWCFYQRALDQDEEPGQHEENTRHPLAYDVAEAMLPVYTRMSDPNLLKRLAKAKTQNPNECLHSVLWSRCPKTVFVGRHKVQGAAASAIAVYNEGASQLTSLMQNMAVEVNEVTLAHNAAKDRLRLYKADIAMQGVAKRRRLVLQRLHNQERAAQTAEEGVTYAPGGF